jgi:hypothetical protein
MKLHLVALVLLNACTADEPPEEDPPIASEIRVTGQAASVSATSGVAPLAYAWIEAYDSRDDVTPIAEATTDVLGNFGLTIETDGMTPFDGYLRAQADGYVDTYVYLPDVLAASYGGVPIRMAMADRLESLELVCGATQRSGNGMIVAFVGDELHTPVEGVTLETMPAANKYCFNGSSGLPDSVRLTTNTDGSGYAFNVTGPVTVSASKGAETFKARKVTARADVVTIVLITP